MSRVQEDRLARVLDAVAVFAEGEVAARAAEIPT